MHGMAWNASCRAMPTATAAKPGNERARHQPGPVMREMDARGNLKVAIIIGAFNDVHDIRPTSRVHRR